MVPLEFQAKCAPPIRDIQEASTVQIEEVEEEDDFAREIANSFATSDEWMPEVLNHAIEAGQLTQRTSMSPLMQDRLQRAMDSRDNMVDGYIMPKKMAKKTMAKPAAKAHEGTGSSSSKD